MKYNYEVFEDNAGGLHLAVMDDDTVIYYLASLDRGEVLHALEELKNGGDPVADYWEGGEEDPRSAYETITKWVEARNGGAWELDI